MMLSPVIPSSFYKQINKYQDFLEQQTWLSITVDDIEFLNIEYAEYELEYFSNGPKTNKRKNKQNPGI